MLLRSFAVLGTSLSLFLIGTGTYALVDPYDVKLSMYDFVGPDEAASWADAWNRAAIHILIGGLLMLWAGLGMWFKRRWSMIILSITCVWLLLAHSHLFAFGQAPSFSNPEAVSEFSVLFIGAIVSIVFYAKWSRFAPSPNKGFNRTPVSSGPAKPGRSGGGVG